jgi:hypothetical protein
MMASSQPLDAVLNSVVNVAVRNVNELSPRLQQKLVPLMRSRICSELCDDPANQGRYEDSVSMLATFRIEKLETN